MNLSFAPWGAASFGKTGRLTSGSQTPTESSPLPRGPQVDDPGTEIAQGLRARGDGQGRSSCRETDRLVPSMPAMSHLGSLESRLLRHLRSPGKVQSRVILVRG